MKKFKHLNADTLDRAVSVLRNYGGKAKVIAGGTDLLGEMQDAILPDYPEVVINLKSIPGMEYIKEENGQLHIGALTKLEDIATNNVIKEKYPVLMEASCKTASPHIREMGTISGNICQSNRCWYYWVEDNRFNCLRKGGTTCYAVNGDARYHSIFGSTRVYRNPCSAACPDNIDIPDYMDRIREGDVTGAARIILEANPLAAITGRVCPHLCEYECNRVGYDESVSIKSVERYVGDYILDNPDVISKPARTVADKKVAIVGSGPAGLSAAFYLNRLGYSVTVFEKMTKAGGLLRYGIPAYRLPKDVVDRQIKLLESAGIRFSTGAKVKISELSRDYDAVFLACGAWKERDSGITGDELFISGMEYLRKINSGERKVPGKKVAVIGGGNAAIDVARTLLRLGAEPVILYRRGREEMPALKEEVEHAEGEGIKMQFLTVPVEASRQTGGIVLKCIKNKLGELDESGRLRPEPIPGSEYTIIFDAVVAALGEEPDTSIVPKSCVDAKGHLKTSEEFHLGDNIFAGGDFVSGPSTVVQATASGRKAAGNINIFLGGKKKRDRKNTGWKAPDRFNSAMLGKTKRTCAPELTVKQRITDLNAEDTGGMSLTNVEQEANRCFNCGCVATNPSDLAPALIALNAEIKTTRRVIPAEKFFTVEGDKTTVLAGDEIVKEVVVPAVAADTRCKFIKFALRKSIDFPLVNCAASIVSNGSVVKSARICLNSVYTQPYRVTKAEDFLKGKSIDVSTAEKAADLITGDAVSLLNNRYKIQIARTLVKRVILACVNTKKKK
jgi:NADPH-dependent glutamate synthase beta subunit-like oxidoreductase/CO/xanthine dehydrogenase FAD-binding subunit